MPRVGQDWALILAIFALTEYGKKLLKVVRRFVTLIPTLIDIGQVVVRPADPSLAS